MCAACNETDGYELSYSKCICKPGRYFKALKCPPYVMGSSIQRLFKGYPYYTQDVNTGIVVIMIYFRCEGLKIPYGIYNSTIVTVNDQKLFFYGYYVMNTTLIFAFMPT